MDHQLVLLKGRAAVKTIRLADGVTTVGRQDGCELTVRSSQVSRKHCQIFEKKGLLLVKDLGSANGTFVNGKRIEEQRVLEPGDVLTIGPIQFRVEKAVAGAEAASAATADVSSGSDAKAKPSDTAVAEPVDAPIPLDEDDVLEFVTGGGDAPAPSAAAAPKAAKAASPKPADAASPAPAPPAANAKPKPKPPAPSKEEPPPKDDVADEAVAEFLMGIEFDEDDQR